MYGHIDPELPLVAICNISETFYEFLSRADEPDTRDRLIHGEQYRGDRALVWLTDPKLVYMSFPVQHRHYLARNFNYPGTTHLVPEEPSPFLSFDILREPALTDALVAYAGDTKVVQIVPYAATFQFYQLVDYLTGECGLTVYLPETPDREMLWIRDYADTKTGFRALASGWLPNADQLLPLGFSCQNIDLAAQVTRWFCINDKTCLIKADIGENGIGNVVHPEDCVSLESIRKRILGNSFLRDDWLTVEEYIYSPGPLSPSLEMFVPAPHIGEPRITYLSKQVFQEFGDFCGVLISRELTQTSWYPTLAEAGYTIARQLQEIGYVGHFDLDAVVDEQDKPYLLEVNTRRTGGTHTHEFARYFFGEDYLDHVALLSNDTMASYGIQDFDTLHRAVGDLLYPINGEQRGVVITGTSALERDEFGCIIVGHDAEDVVALQQATDQQVRAAVTA